MWSGDEVSSLLSEVETVEIAHSVKKPTTTSIDGDRVTLKEMQVAQSESVIRPLRSSSRRSCDATQPKLQPAKPKKKRQTAKTIAKKAKNDDVLEEPAQATKKKRQTKTMDKKSRKALQDSIKSTDLDILVNEGTAALTEEFSDSHLSAFVADVCESKRMLAEFVEYLRNTFAMLHSECKLEKNSQMQFQLKWYSYCSAFLLEEKHTLSAINLEEAKHPVLVNLRQVWLEFCREQTVSVAERNSVMTIFSSAIYSYLLAHVASFQESMSGSAETTSGLTTEEEDGVYYRFGGGTLCEMLHRRYKQIRDAANKNLMSIEISVLQAINSKDKSDIPDYLKYRDRGFMYFPHRCFIPFLKKVDKIVKKVTNMSGLNEHGDDLVKVNNYHKSLFLLSCLLDCP